MQCARASSLLEPSTQHHQHSALLACMHDAAAGRHSCMPASRRGSARPAAGRAPWATYGFPIRASGVWSLDSGQQDRSLRRRSSRPRWRKGRGRATVSGLFACAGRLHAGAACAEKKSARRSKLDLCSFWWIGSPVLIPTPCSMLKSQARTSQKRLPRMKDRLTEVLFSSLKISSFSLSLHHINL
jgi:hypothetical protein